MARVPLGLGGSSGTIRSSDNDDDNDSAKYSWVVASSTTTTSRGSKPAVGARDDHGSVSIEQYMYDIAGTTSETASGGSNDNDNANGGNHPFQPEPIPIPIRTISPFHQTTIVPSTPTSTSTSVPNTNESSPLFVPIASKAVSHLGRDDGMHRLFHHSFPLHASKVEASTDGTTRSGRQQQRKHNLRYFLYVTLPSGMFIDLDNPFELPATTGKIQIQSQSTSSSKTEGGTDASTDATATTTKNENRQHHGFVATCLVTQSQTQTPRQLVSFRARLHAATICDIEQPSFVSGQHLLVWELDNIYIVGNDNDNDAKETTTTTKATTLRPPILIEFATKLHLRYPHPSSTMEEWIDLPRPLLFAARTEDPPHPHSDADEKLDDGPNRDNLWFWGNGDDNLGLVHERVWVAAGKDEDHDFVSAATIFFCLVGVAIMLRDISNASLWDDV
uniref:Uncharacterized protein n=1 Tax=Pseudo-nitzschia australis TaxID=44445 RepID=A0A7S4AVC3_9STRA